MNYQGESEIGFALFVFAQRSWQTRSAERSRRRPDQGEDNPNRKGAAGNGRV